MKPLILMLSSAILVGGCGHRTDYAHRCGALPAGWITPRDGRPVMSLLNVISVASNGTVSWNHAKVSEPLLATYLLQVRKLNPLPITQIKFDPAVDCDRVYKLRRLMIDTLDCRGGVCAEGSGKWWKIGDVVFDGKASKAYDPDAAPPKQP